MSIKRLHNKRPRQKSNLTIRMVDDRMTEERMGSDKMIADRGVGSIGSVKTSFPTVGRSEAEKDKEKR